MGLTRGGVSPTSNLDRAFSLFPCPAAESLLVFRVNELFEIGSSSSSIIARKASLSCSAMGLTACTAALRRRH